VALTAPAQIHFGLNGWKDIQDMETIDTGLGVHVAELPTEALKAGDSVEFTFLWRDSKDWEGRNYEVAIVAP
jgi:glucoamylase